VSVLFLFPTTAHSFAPGSTKARKQVSLSLSLQPFSLLFVRSFVDYSLGRMHVTTRNNKEEKEEEEASKA